MLAALDAVRPEYYGRTFSYSFCALEGGNAFVSVDLGFLVRQNYIDLSVFELMNIRAAGFTFAG